MFASVPRTMKSSIKTSDQGDLMPQAMLDCPPPPPPKDNEEFDQDVGSRRSNASSYVRLSVSMALSMPTN